MQLEERQSHSNCMTWFKELKIHLDTLHNNREKIFHNLNKLQWQVERDNFHGSDSETCLDALRTQFKKFFDSKELNDLDFHNKCWQKNFIDYTGCELETLRRNLLWYFEELDKLIDERTQESLVSEGATMEPSLVIEGATLEASLVTEGAALEASLDTEDADIGHSYDSDTVFKVHHDIFENMFVHGIQNHEQPESIPDTYMVNENNSNIISDIPNTDPDKDKEAHDYVDYEQHRASLLP
ncbi:hypothetical protein Tco_1244747 [Tanacetum coccineum]